MKAAFHLTGLIAASTLLVAAVLGALYAAGMDDHIVALFDWIEQLGWRGMLMLGVLDLVAVVALVPGVFLTLGAGFLFGIVAGSLIIIVATTLGACMAFALARLFVSTRAGAGKRLPARTRALIDATAEGGWRTVLLTRLVPFFPFKLANYALGTTRLGFAEFVLGTVVGIVPLTLFNVTLGSLAGDLATALVAPREHDSVQWTVYVLGLVPLALLVVSIGRRADRRLQATVERRMHTSAVPGESA
ncbi:MAG: VTT domain-containing protein [Gammaproteobacteria bacterium]